MQMSTSGGLSDSEAKEETVIAVSPRGPRAVTTVTPLAQSLSVSLNCCAPIANAPRAPPDPFRGGEITLGACPPRPGRRRFSAARTIVSRGARIESLFLAGPAGRLEAVLKHPAEDPASGADGLSFPKAAAVVCHPHPLFGGTLHNKVVHAAAEALVRRGMPTLRFNFRGVGRSGGKHDHGRGEQDDLRAALAFLDERFPGRPIVAAGYSFGSFVALAAGCGDPRVAMLIGIAVPAGLYPFGFLRACDKPLVLIQGERDPLAPLPLVLTLAAGLPSGARVVPIASADHAFHGRLDEVGRRVEEAAGALS
jgi:alpha/beta superfamily hydrolase